MYDLRIEIRAAVARYQYAEICRSMTAAEINAIFAGPVLGIEVTDEAMVARCDLGNIDPKHGHHRPPTRGQCAPHRAGEPASWYVARGALRYDCAPEGAVLVTSRADLDAVCAMAEIAIVGGFAYTDLGVAVERLGSDPLALGHCDRSKAVADADCFDVGATPWQPSPLPTIEEPWAAHGGTLDARRKLAGISAAVMDASIPLATRVEWAATWLLMGDEPSGYRERVEAARRNLVAQCTPERVRLAPDVIRRRAEELACLQWQGDSRYAEDEEMVYRMEADSLRILAASEAATSVSVVEIEHQGGATTIGYCLAPVVVCGRPSDGKITIASWGKQYDYAALVATLNGDDGPFASSRPKWGGNPRTGIIGAPTMKGSRFYLPAIVVCVVRAVQAHRAPLGSVAA